MHVVVVGCGRVGSELAGLLEQAGHTVAIVDKRANAFRRLPTGFRGKTIVGFGFDRDTLIEAGIERAGALAAVTSGDNSNIMSARVGRETFEIERVVARIYDPRRAAIYQRLGIPTVRDGVMGNRSGDAAAAAGCAPGGLGRQHGQCVVSSSATCRRCGRDESWSSSRSPDTSRSRP